MTPVQPPETAMDTRTSEISLRIAREDVVVATKGYGPTGAGPNSGGNSRAHLIEACKASLKRLQLDHLDLYQVHGFDPATPIEETLRALDTLVQHGHVRYVGVSNWAAWQIAKALGVAEREGLARFESLQAYYTLAGRDLEREIVPMLRSEGVGLMVWSPLAGGLLSGKYTRERDTIAGDRRAAFAFFMRGGNVEGVCGGAVAGQFRRDPRAPRDGSAVGGRVLGTGSLELARPLSRRSPDFLGAVFIDGGNADTSWNNFQPAYGWGLGLRWRSPVGPLKIDWAYGEYQLPVPGDTFTASLARLAPSAAPSLSAHSTATLSSLRSWATTRVFWARWHWQG